MSVIKRLEQAIIEGRYSRKLVRQTVLLEVNESLSGVMLEPFTTACDLALTWLNKPAITRQGKPWPKRQALKQHILSLHYERKFTITDLITELMLCIFPIEGAQSIQGIAGRIANQLDLDNVFDAVQMASELIAVIEPANLYSIILASDSETGTILVESNWTLSTKTLDYIANTKYLPPMICEPCEITKNTDSAHLTVNGSIILKAENHHEEYQNYDNLNILNSIPLSIDMNMVQYEEEASKPLDTPEKVLNFERIKGASRAVYNELLEHGNKFYIPWKYDKRGREYSQGYHLHIQSNEYKKSLINLNTEEVITL